VAYSFEQDELRGIDDLVYPARMTRGSQSIVGPDDDEHGNPLQYLECMTPIMSANVSEKIPDHRERGGAQ